MSSGAIIGGRFVWLGGFKVLFLGFFSIGRIVMSADTD